MLRYQIEPRRTYVHAVLAGDLDMAGAQSTYSAILHEAARLSVSRILLDVTGVHGQWEPADRLAFAAFVADEHARRGQWPQVAILAAPPLMDPAHFTQVAANNRGVRLRTSDNLQELLSWLGV